MVNTTESAVASTATTHKSPPRRGKSFTIMVESPPKKEAKLAGKKERKQSAIYQSRADQVEGGRVVGRAKTQPKTSRERHYFKQTKKRPKIMAHPTIM